MATPTDTPERQDQRSDRAWHEWMGVAVGLTGLMSIMATIVAVVALSSSNNSPTTATVTQAAAAPARPAATQVALPAPESLKVAVKADDEHGRLGPDKQWHDAFLPADFSVQAGAKVTLTVSNYDGGPHTFTSPTLGLSQVIPGGGSMSKPKVVTFSFIAPKTPGKYQWWCAVPCDPWAMAHDGYMRGVVNVTS